MIRKVSENLNVYQNHSTQQKKKITENKKIDRVEEIKQQIKNGTYKVDIEKTAEAMAKNLLK